MTDDAAHATPDEGALWRADRRLDARGIACPLPVLKARKLLGGMARGSRLMVEATDPMAAIDIPHLCQQDGHRLIRQERLEESGRLILRFLIERGATGAQSD
ncbi:sulfurtransferase TusA family protein [Kaistia defluvii]|uniref:sulfurtransferase TusA family protein n=1 Tax=Kaistia defluvii TaxID=410841 RepID=UPI002253DD3C|nr:sulfurtransferase TusA family protein [Kaistia defluvii]MCX5518492.1 sulfurtransferase TusA family protein [Kaistia defluvii]